MCFLPAFAISSLDSAARHVRVPGHAVHPDLAAAGGAEAPGDPSLDVPLEPRVRDDHVLLQLPPGRGLAQEIRRRTPLKARHGHQMRRRRGRIHVSSSYLDHKKTECKNPAADVLGLHFILKHSAFL